MTNIPIVVASKETLDAVTEILNQYDNKSEEMNAEMKKHLDLAVKSLRKLTKEEFDKRMEECSDGDTAQWLLETRALEIPSKIEQHFDEITETIKNMSIEEYFEIFNEFQRAEGEK